MKPKSIIRRLYDWTVHWAETRQATWALFLLAFAESSFFPIPPDPLLMAMTTVKPEKYLRFATICTLASVIGGIAGYYIGVFFFETIGQAIVDFYHLQEAFTAVGQKYEQYAFLTVFTAAFTPIPYKIITIAAGVFRVSLPSFVLASIFGRASRFFLVALLMHHLGKRFQDKIAKYIDILSIIFVILLIGGFIVIKYVL